MMYRTHTLLNMSRRKINYRRFFHFPTQIFPLFVRYNSSVVMYLLLFTIFFIFKKEKKTVYARRISGQHSGSGGSGFGSVTMALKKSLVPTILKDFTKAFFR
jgi:hypothetical protein